MAALDALVSQAVAVAAALELAVVMRLAVEAAKAAMDGLRQLLARARTMLVVVVAEHLAQVVVLVELVAEPLADVTVDLPHFQQRHIQAVAAVADLQVVQQMVVLVVLES